jgi:hypothetical protein
VDLKEPVRRLFENEGEGFQRFIGAEPAEFAFAPVELGLEVFRIRLTNETVDTIGGDDQIGIRELFQVGDFTFEFEPNPQVASALVEDQEKPLAR